MTEKIEEIRKALEVYESDFAIDADLVDLAPDMAGIALAAEKLANAVNVMRLMPHGVTNEVTEAYIAYRKAVEGHQ